MTMKTKAQNHAQALVEWVVFAFILFSVWFCFFKLARNLWKRTQVEFWSVMSARQALSNAETTLPLGLHIENKITENKISKKIQTTAELERFKARMYLDFKK